MRRSTGRHRDAPTIRLLEKCACRERFRERRKQTGILGKMGLLRPLASFIPTKLRFVRPALRLRDNFGNVWEDHNDPGRRS